jgi:hypothetical protein
MKLQGELAIGALDLLLCGAASNPEHLVIITFSVAGQNRPFPNRFRVRGLVFRISRYLHHCRTQQAFFELVAAL